MRGFHCLGCRYGKYVPSQHLKACVFVCERSGDCPRTKMKKGEPNDKGRMQKAIDDN